MVCDFPDVFQAELLGMPPDRAVEFFIDLEPGTSPTSNQPYKNYCNNLMILDTKIIFDPSISTFFPSFLESRGAIPSRGGEL